MPDFVYEVKGFKVQRLTAHAYFVWDAAMHLIAELDNRKDADTLANMCAA